MCKNNIELDSLTKENLGEVYNTLEEIEKGNMLIVGQEHLIKNFKTEDGLVPMGEIYNIEIIYTCKMCKNRLNDIGICKDDQKYHETICLKFRRE